MLIYSTCGCGSWCCRHPVQKQGAGCECVSIYPCICTYYIHIGYSHTLYQENGPLFPGQSTLWELQGRASLPSRFTEQTNFTNNFVNHNIRKEQSVCPIRPPQNTDCKIFLNQLPLPKATDKPAAKPLLERAEMSTPASCPRESTPQLCPELLQALLWMI